MGNKDEDKHFTVYKHTTPNNKCYIGITGQKNYLKRWQKGFGYKGQVFFYAIEKYGWDNIKHEIIAEDLTEKEAQQLEIELIGKYKSNDPKYGYNISSGGKGTRHYNVGIVDENHLNHYSRAVNQYDLKFNFIASYNSIIEAAKETNTNPYALSNACNQRLLTANNYIWIHKDRDTLQYREKLKQRLSNSKRYNNQSTYADRPVICFDCQLNYIYTYKNINSAKKAINRNNGQPIFLSCVSQQYSAYGYVWRFADEVSDLLTFQKDNFHLIPNKYKTVLKFDLNKKFICRYENSIIASKDKENDITCGRVIEICKRNRNYCNGYIYRFENDCEFNIQKEAA